MIEELVATARGRAIAAAIAVAALLAFVKLVSLLRRSARRRRGRTPGVDSGYLARARAWEAQRRATAERSQR